MPKMTKESPVATLIDYQSLIGEIRSLCSEPGRPSAEPGARASLPPALLQRVADALEESCQAHRQLRSEVERLRRQEQALVETVRYTREELEHRIEEISLVRLVAEMGIRCLLSEDPLEFILEHVSRLTDSEHGSIMLLDSGKGRLYLAASNGPDQIPPYERSYKLGEGIARWVDRSLSAAEPPLDSAAMEVLRENDGDHGSLLCYPLIVDSGLVGVLSIGHSRQGAFTADTERILCIIANQVALAVHNAYLLSLHKEQKTHLQRSHERYRSLVERVNDLIDLARLEAGNLNYEKRPLRLRETLTGLRPHYKSELRKKNIRMQVQIPKRIPKVSGDEERLRQALSILMENVLRCTPDNGRITLQVTIEEFDPARWPQVKRRSASGKFLLFRLSDTAPSIPHQLLGGIFEKIPGGNGSLTAARGGSLSLYLAKEIIEYHGGQIWLESGDTEGNTYSFTLPIS